MPCSFFLFSFLLSPSLREKKNTFLYSSIETTLQTGLMDSEYIFASNNRTGLSLLHLVNSGSVQWKKHYSEGVACSFCHGPYGWPHNDKDHSLQLLWIYPMLDILQTPSYLTPIDIRGRPSSHFTDEPAEDQRKGMACWAPESRNSTRISSSPVLSSPPL